MPIRMTGMYSGIDTESMIKELINAQKLKNKKVSDKLTKSEWKEEKWKELNAKLYKLYTEDLSKMRLQGNYLSKKVSSSNESIIEATSGTTAAIGSHTISDVKLASAQKVTSGIITYGGSNATEKTKLSDLGVTVGTKINFTVGAASPVTLDVTADTTLSDLVSKAQSAGLNADYDENQGRLFISSKESGIDNAFGITATTSGGAADNAQLDFLQLDALNTDGTKVDPVASLSTVIEAANSQMTYNGVTITGSSNTISVNGLNITLKGETTAGQEINLNVSDNTEATYDMVKNFIKSYNEILAEMNKLYYADSSRGYNPLSDDEKEAMTDDQVTKWETKIKDSILRRDSILGSNISTMKMAMMSSVTVDGKQYSLASYGIETSRDFTEKGLLHIHGNADDAVYSDKEDKLKKALLEDPDTVMQVLSGISKELYDTMTDKMKSIPNVSSALTVYNDKLLDKEQKEYKKKVAILEGKLKDMENKYYKQFSAMETALAKLQSQQNALAGMLGQ